ncbi:hypothetical protein B7494_g3170 [Chlorociboria aeruginascens]|nr:hypothetical protein B7494_g3170 [Chlorociboria aeruginascens]
MALQVFIAHTGQCLRTDPPSFTSLETFKAWVARHSSIAASDHIALTSQGKAVRFQALLTEASISHQPQALTDRVQKEIYVYDGRIIQAKSPNSAKALVSDIPLPKKYTPSKPPDTIADQTDLETWRNLFMARRTWALKVVDDCTVMSGEAKSRYDEIAAIIRSVDAASMNLERHVRVLDQKNIIVQSWVADLQKEQELAGMDWEASLARLQSIPATTEMIQFITGRDAPKSPTLEDLIEIEETKKAGKLLHNVAGQMSRRSAELGRQVEEVLRGTDQLFERAKLAAARTAVDQALEPVQLLQDIEAIARKVHNDYESVLGYPNTAKNISQASKSALLHTRSFLPTLSKRSLEMDELLQFVTELRNKTAIDAIEIMHFISTLTSMVSEANVQYSSIEADGAGFEGIHSLSKLNTLPIIYTSFVAEAIRRREWNDKVKSDSSTLANEMATFQDEEVRRRRKWQKTTGSALWGDKTERKVIGLEVNLHGEEEEWPLANRRDLEEILEILQSQDANSGIVTEISKIIYDLNNPTKQQNKRAKAFKAGSIHEVALGRSALLVRGDEDLIRVLQEDKSRTEIKLKSAESRVRRLEDVLHRQSHISRTSSGPSFQLPGNPSSEFQAANPLTSTRLNDDMSRRSSVSSRRFSSNQGAEEKVFQQKLLSLESERVADRERVSVLEKEISSRIVAEDEMKARFEELNSTKGDLMQNFEAQQREFIEERKSLEGEIKRLKTKLDELEDEMDRYLGSRENEKANVDERVKHLQDELDKLRKETTAEAQKAQGQVDFLRNDAKLQRETNESLEKQLQRVKEENKEIKARSEEAESTVGRYLRALHSVHTQLAPESEIPLDIGDLTETLVNTSTDITAELELTKHNIAIAKSDLEKAQAATSEAKTEITSLKEILSTEEMESFQLRETLGVERAKFAALEGELTDEREQLSSLRTRIADGETGSEALQTRLEEEERRVTTLSEDLAARQSEIGSLEEELRAFQDKFQDSQSKYEKLTGRFESRTARTKDLTQRVYTQNDRLCRLLERLSYSVTRESNSMVIQRLPKPERSNANDSSDPGSTLRRSISGALTKKAMADSGDLDLLYWMHNEDSETESEKYEAYMNALGSFDIEAFCEVVTKRIKDVEYTAKKYSRDARAYREKSHSAQKEAHEKIAFKNFKEGDLALFLPTRNQATGAWAAFNVGAPHYFLREQDSHKLRTRDWLLARIHKIEDRVVDLSKSISSTQPNASDGTSFGAASNGGDSFEDDNPFDLSDGLRWYLIDAAEEKPGAPSTPGLGKSTVASAHIDATGSIRHTKKSSSGVDGINKTLSKSLDSRRSSSNSKKATSSPSALVKTGSTTSVATSLKAAPATQPTEVSLGAQLIGTSSKQDDLEGGLVLQPSRQNENESAGRDKVPNPEVGNHNIDSLLGP